MFWRYGPPLSPCQVRRGLDIDVLYLFVCLFVCLSVTLLNDKVCDRYFRTSPQARWNSETILVPLDRGMSVDVHPL